MKTTKISIPANSEVLLNSDENFKFTIEDDKGVELKRVPYVDAEKGTLLRVRQPSNIIAHSKTEVIAVVTDISKALENLDVIPIEAPVDEQHGLSLQDKMKALIHDYAKNYFGDNQMDSLEDVLDVDFNDDGIIGTSEVSDMTPEIPTPPQPPQTQQEVEPPSPELTPQTTPPIPTPGPAATPPE